MKRKIYYTKTNPKAFVEHKRNTGHNFIFKKKQQLWTYRLTIKKYTFEIINKHKQKYNINKLTDAEGLLLHTAYFNITDKRG